MSIPRARWRFSELTVVDGYGECIATRFIDGSLRVDRADPRILVSVELLDLIRRDGGDPRVVADDDLLHIKGVNQTVIYRIGDKTPDGLALSPSGRTSASTCTQVRRLSHFAVMVANCP